MDEIGRIKTKEKNSIFNLTSATGLSFTYFLDSDGSARTLGPSLPFSIWYCIHFLEYLRLKIALHWFPFCSGRRRLNALVALACIFTKGTGGIIGFLIVISIWQSNSKILPHFLYAIPTTTIGTNLNAHTPSDQFSGLKSGHAAENYGKWPSVPTEPKFFDAMPR